MAILLAFLVIVQLGRGLTTNEIPAIEFNFQQLDYPGEYNFRYYKCLAKLDRLNGDPREDAASKSVTMCARFKFQFFSERLSVVLSGTDNPLRLDVYRIGEYPYSLLRISYRMFETTLERPMANDQLYFFYIYPKEEMYLRKWYNFCFSYEADTDNVTAILNGDVIFRYHNDGMNEVAKPQFGGSFYMSCTDLTYDTTSKFYGRFTDLQIFNLALPELELQEFTTCQKALSGNVLNWPNINISLSAGNSSMKPATSLRNVSVANFCEEPVYRIAFGESHRLPHNQAYNFCRRFQGELAIPDSLEEEEEWCREYQPPEGYDSNKYHLPITDNVRNNVWLVDGTGNASHAYENWHRLEPNGGNMENCSVLHIVKMNSSEPDSKCRSFWADWHCQTEFGFICKFKKTIRLKLRGLCPRSHLDTEYTMVWLKNKGKMVFKGNYATSLNWVNESNFWLLKSMKDKSIYAFNNQSKKHYPLGTHQWFVVNDTKCSGKYGMEQKYLTLTSCIDGQFTCDNGECIDFTKRCDFSTDCYDQSDENSCDLVYISEDIYQADFPPVGKDRKILNELQVRFRIKDIGEISELDGIVSMTVVLNVIWKDIRLYFIGLKETRARNTLSEEEKHKIWIPSLTFANSKRKLSTILDKQTAISVIKRGDPIKASPKLLKETDFYRGSDNWLVMRREYNIKILCTFQLKRYPFDVQKCSVDLELPFDLTQYASINITHARYTGTENLPQFLMGNGDLKTLNEHSRNDTVFLKLQRRYAYHIFTAYVPTICLSMITHASHYFPKEHFEAAVMVCLTSMLVMTTLLLQVSSSLPVTAYMKLIDIWMLFGIVMPFFDFILITIARVFDSEEGLKTIGLAWKEQKNCFNGDTVRRFSKIAMPLIHGFFNIIYWIVVLFF